MERGQRGIGVGEEKMENENSIWTNLYPLCSFVSVKQTINCGRSFRSEVLRAHKRSLESPNASYQKLDLPLFQQP